MVYKNTDTQILTLFYMVYVNSLKCIKNKSFYVMKMKFIDVCLIVIKIFLKKFLQISLYKNRFSGAEPLKTQTKIKER